MADRQTALAVFDFLDSLRAGQYRIGADAEKDHATAGLLASLSGDTGLRDAVCAKLISPGLERARFLMVAEHDPHALPLFASGQVKPWYQADYNVREIANSEFHQDIPALLWRLSNNIPDSARREGALEAAAYMSFMQGDPEAAFTGHLGRLAAVSPEGEVTRCLMDAHEHGQHPAWVMEQRQLRERQADAADMLAEEGLQPRRNHVIIMDEMHRALRASPLMVEKLDLLTRLNRQWGVGQIMITHTFKDLMCMETPAQNTKARGFVERSEIKVLGALSRIEVDRYLRGECGLPVSRREEDMLEDWATPVNFGSDASHKGLGRFLIKLGGLPGIPINVEMCPLEKSGFNDTNLKWHA